MLFWFSLLAESILIMTESLWIGLYATQRRPLSLARPAQHGARYSQYDSDAESDSDSEANLSYVTVDCNSKTFTEDRHCW